MSEDKPHDDQTQYFAALLTDTQVSQYKIIEKIGSGGMGDVYLAHDSQLDRRVALKFLAPHLCQDEDCRKRFKREAQAAARLDHHSIVTVYEVGDFHTRPYIAMQYIEGKSLKDRLSEGRMPLQTAIDITAKLCKGLSNAHDSGIIHRDIKPSNILIDTHGNPRLVDFGLAAVQGSEQLTHSGSTMGTIEYMSPEQVRGDPSDNRSDLFSLGVVLYEMITGKSPYKADNITATMNRILQAAPLPISQYRTDAPLMLQDIITRILEKESEKRYKSAHEICCELERLAGKSTPVIVQSDPESSIAVLPFANLSADPEQEYFCDGMAEEIINALTKLAGLRVVARTSCFAFKGKQQDIREIGHKLNVNTVLEGSVRKAGNRLRITAQLINVADGFHLWSERFDRQMVDVFEIQDEITAAIVKKLKGKLLAQVDVKELKHKISNLDAYHLYLQGRYHWNLRSTEAIFKAINLFEKAIALEPKYALAYVGLSDCYGILHQNMVMRPEELYPKAREYALKALELDSDLGEAHTSLAMILFYWDWDWTGAEREFNKAIELNPGYATAYQWYALYLGSRMRIEEAEACVRKALDLDPMSLIMHIASAWILTCAGRLEEAEMLCQKTIDMNPHFYMVHFSLAYIYFKMDRQRDCISEFHEGLIAYGIVPEDKKSDLRDAVESSNQKKFLEIYVRILEDKSLREYVSPANIANVYLWLEQPEIALRMYEKAVEEHDPELVTIAMDPGLDIIKGDQRFKPILDALGLS
jgi:TolB-like protein/Flp pilus assembly protein TadD